MNSAVEPLLKVINELKEKVNTLSMDQSYLLQEVRDLRDRVNTLEANHMYGHMNTSIPITTPYWTSISTAVSWNVYWSTWQTPTISDVEPGNNWTLTFTYTDGRTVTISPEV